MRKAQPYEGQLVLSSGHETKPQDKRRKVAQKLLSTQKFLLTKKLKTSTVNSDEYLSKRQPRTNTLSAKGNLEHSISETNSKVAQTKTPEVINSKMKMYK